MDIYSAKSDEYDLPEVRLKQKATNIVLPFPPYVGMSVSDDFSPIDPSEWDKKDHEFGNFYSGQIEKVHWNNVSKSFDCEVTPLYLNNYTGMSEEKRLGAVIANREQCGWKIDGYDPKAKKSFRRMESAERSQETTILAIPCPFK